MSPSPEETMLLPGIHATNVKTYIHMNTCAWIFTAALCMIAKTRPQTRCPSGAERINDLCDIQTMEHFFRANGK